MKSKKKSQKAQLIGCGTPIAERLVENFKKRVEEVIEELRNQRAQRNEPTKKEHSE
jgi:hypothetical protein